MLTALEQQTNFTNGLAEATRFFMGRADVQLAAERLSAALSEMGIPYVIAGGLAVGAHGYQRMTDDVDVLVSVGNLSRFEARWIGRGWVERFPGSKNMRDAETGVKVDVLLVGDYPGDGKPAGDGTQNSCGIPDEELVALLGSTNTEGSGSSPP